MSAAAHRLGHARARFAPLVALIDFVPALILVAIVFMGSTYLAAMPMRHEVRRAVQRGEAMPRIVNWWQGVVRRGWWIVLAGGILVATGALVWSRGQSDAGGWLALIGLGLAAYVVQGVYLMRVVRRTAERAAREREPLL